jgi:hypothetical protein
MLIFFTGRLGGIDTAYFFITKADWLFVARMAFSSDICIIQQQTLKHNI